MAILIVVDDPTGHRLSYVRMLIANAMDADVVVLARDTLQLAEQLALHLPPSDLQYRLQVLPRLDLPAIAAAAHRVQATLVIHPDGDELALLIGRGARWPSAVPLRLLIMRPGGQTGGWAGRRVRGLAKRALFWRARRTAGVELIILRSAARRGLSSREAPDPVEALLVPEVLERLRRELALEPDQQWFGVLGAIDARKNPALVAEALCSIPDRAGLLIAGRMTEEARQQVEIARGLLERSGRPLVVLARLLEDDELDALVAACSAVVLAHSNDGPSGILGKALALHTPILAAGAAGLRRDVREIGTGALWVPLRTEALAGGMHRILRSPSPRGAVASAADFAVALLGRSAGASARACRHSGVAPSTRPS